jgi:DNA-binding NtrC family response regulator
MSIHVLALEKDLFFSVKMRDTLRHYDIEVKTVRNLPAFEESLRAKADEEFVLSIVNTAITGVDWETAIRKAREAGLKVLAFGSHMDLEARSKALEAGAQRVVANSKFTSDMPGLVLRMLDEPDDSSLKENGSESESAIQETIAPWNEHDTLS